MSATEVHRAWSTASVDCRTLPSSLACQCDRRGTDVAFSYKHPVACGLVQDVGSFLVNLIVLL